MSKRKENPMPRHEIMKRMHDARLKKMAEAKEKKIASGKMFCRKCETDKPISEYAMAGGGRSQAYCKQCNAIYNKKRTAHASENLTDWYIKDFGRRHYGIGMKSYFSPELMDALKYEILARRSAKSLLTIDGKTFDSLNKFALYVQQKYGVGHHAVKRRIYSGNPIEHAALSHDAMRRNFTGGPIPIKCINTKTGEALYFESQKVAARSLHIGEATIRNCLLTQDPNKLYNNSINFNTYKFYKDESRNAVANELRRTLNRP